MFTPFFRDETPEFQQDTCQCDSCLDRKREMEQLAELIVSIYPLIRDDLSWGRKSFATV